MKLPALLLLSAIAFTANGQQAPEIKRIPPPGIEVPAADRAEIEAGLKEFGTVLSNLRRTTSHPNELPNVEIFFKSADWALRYNEVFDAKQIPIVKEHIQQGIARAASLKANKMPWNTATGLVVRAYRSKIDGSVQPYGLLIPEGLKPGAKVPLHFWCHGRNEKLSELAFIDGSQKNKGEFTPDGAIVCFLYGRFCNANKFAGEVDLFEALEDIKKYYPIDEQRLVIRGFSMGGAACWQFATHHAGMWAAAAPGAGFAETAEFFKVFAEGKEAPPWWEQVLWRWYDCTTMAANLSNTTTVAYSGEIDGQKQAADIMTSYAEKEGIKFPHIIGPQTPHKYHPDSKVEINKLVDAALANGRELVPKKVQLVTYTPMCGKSAWVELAQMEKQWERAEIKAEWTGTNVAVTTKNVASFFLQFRLANGEATPSSADVDGQKLPFGMGLFHKDDGKWKEGDILETLTTKSPPLYAKAPRLCGPIDHAFMSRFVFVRPTGKPLNDAVGTWSKSEMDRAIAQWRQVFRGEAIVIDDTAVTDVIAKDANLVAWGDLSSNKYLAKIADKLPLKWNSQTLEMRGQKVDAAHHAPILIYPNPLNPARYIVLNSGPTFREAAALNNSDQTPKLPDWAIVDLRTPPGPKWPGQIVDAGFFDENWR